MAHPENSVSIVAVEDQHYWPLFRHIIPFIQKLRKFLWRVPWTSPKGMIKFFAALRSSENPFGASRKYLRKGRPKGFPPLSEGLWRSIPGCLQWVCFSICENGVPLMFKVYFYAVDLAHGKQTTGTCSGQSMFRVSALKWDLEHNWCQPCVSRGFLHTETVKKVPPCVNRGPPHTIYHAKASGRQYFIAKVRLKSQQASSVIHCMIDRSAPRIRQSDCLTAVLPHSIVPQDHDIPMNNKFRK